MEALPTTVSRWVWNPYCGFAWSVIDYRELNGLLESIKNIKFRFFMEKNDYRKITDQEYDDIFKLIKDDKLYLACFERTEPVYKLIKNLIIDPPAADSTMRLHRFTIDGQPFHCYDGFFKRDARVLTIAKKKLIMEKTKEFIDSHITHEKVASLLTALEIIANGDPISVGLDEITEVAQAAIDYFESDEI